MRRFPIGSGVALMMGLQAMPAVADLRADFIAAADRGKCIESEAFLTIRRNLSAAAEVVEAAIAAHARRAQQQRAMGCQGDIAAQAIAAGADPEQVLKATAAGL